MSFEGFVFRLPQDRKWMQHLDNSDGPEPAMLFANFPADAPPTLEDIRTSMFIINIQTYKPYTRYRQVTNENEFIEYLRGQYYPREPQLASTHGAVCANLFKRTYPSLSIHGWGYNMDHMATRENYILECLDPNEHGRLIRFEYAETYPYTETILESKRRPDAEERARRFLDTVYYRGH